MEVCARRFEQFGESIFSKMTRLANESGALNFAQGFPDFSGPKNLIKQIQFHSEHCPNQYTRSAGHEKLCLALGDYAKDFFDLTLDPMNEICVTNGATGGIMSTIIGLLDPHEKILVFEPYYEPYAQNISVAQGQMIGVELKEPATQKDFDEGFWSFDHDDFAQKAKSAKIILLNHPHNPCGKVFSFDELEFIFSKAEKNNCLILIDGAYEHLVYPPHQQHIFSFVKKYFDRSIYVSSIAKTFSFTGFKIGWVFASKKLMRGIRLCHESSVFCIPPHLQLAVADILNDKQFLKNYLPSFQSEFLHKRDLARKVLSEFGFMVPKAQGTYFLMAKIHNAPLNATNADELAMELLKNYGVASVPMSQYFVGTEKLQDYLRFAFCKKEETLTKMSSNFLSPT